MQRNGEAPPELWGGLECTVVRLNDGYRDQLAETGHREREGDLAAIAELGVKTLRYPILWESVSPERADQTHWGWHDRQLGRLSELGMCPIAGLLHHGSGPRYTNLLDPEFPRLLAAHAQRVAERYPWIELFTPVNEPLTTSRFSCLYGHWYPHRCDHQSFLRALFNQCAGVRLSMQAIRRVTPSARLVQTDDLGKTFATPLLQYQADFENERRWLTFDLLTGRVDTRHPFRGDFLRSGVSERELAALCEDPCPPDIVGINHYLTSERYLDHEWQPYDACFRGGNGRHRYADVEAIRIDLAPGSLGPRERLREAWQRYGLPLAVTEAHLGCSRDDQLRWLMEVWNAVCALRREGADIRAVTVWSLFGAVDWNTLLTRRRGFYEPGAFDIRAPEPRRTAIAQAAASLARTGAFQHPILDGPGWWRRRPRFYRKPPGRTMRTPARRVLALVGATSSLGRAFARMCEARGVDYTRVSVAGLCRNPRETLASELGKRRPWAVINATGMQQAPDPERGRRGSRTEQRLAWHLASACSNLGLPLLTFSSDLVFDGRLGRPYAESDTARPACPAGSMKLGAEISVQEICPDALIVRAGACFGHGTGNFLTRILAQLAAGRAVALDDQRIMSPTYMPDLVHAALDLLIDGEKGLWHLANAGAVSWYGLAIDLSDRARTSTRLLRPLRRAAMNTALRSERGFVLPTWQEALARFVEGTPVLQSRAVCARAV